MLRIRRMEERCAQLYGEQKIRGFLHLAIGEEAVAAGVLPHLQPQDKVVATLPSARSPTISQLATPDWVAVETVIAESVVREIIPRLKSLGAEGIVEYPLNKIVH